MLQLDEEEFRNIVYSETNENIEKSEVKRFSNIYNDNITEQFKYMQERVMNREKPILTRLLAETFFEAGYESEAERYFAHLSSEYGIIADTVLQNIYLENMYNNLYLLKHLLFIVENLPEDRRSNLTIIPLAGLANPDLEIQDLSVKCFEAWGEREHIPSLISLRDKTAVEWFRNYIDDVIQELKEG